jgi:hypothetical protein
LQEKFKSKRFTRSNKSPIASRLLHTSCFFPAAVRGSLHQRPLRAILAAGSIALGGNAASETDVDGTAEQHCNLERRL